MSRKKGWSIENVSFYRLCEELQRRGARNDEGMNGNYKIKNPKKLFLILFCEAKIATNLTRMPRLAGGEHHSAVRFFGRFLANNKIDEVILEEVS